MDSVQQVHVLLVLWTPEPDAGGVSPELLFPRLLHCCFPVKNYQREHHFNCCTMFLQCPAPEAGGSVSSGCGMFCAGLTGAVVEELKIPNNWSIPKWQLCHCLLAHMCDVYREVSLLQDSLSISWTHRSNSSWSTDLSVDTLHFWGHVLGCSTVAPSLLTNCSQFPGYTTEKYLCLSLHLSPKKPFFESFFFSLRGIKWNTNIWRLRIKARELWTFNDFIFAPKKWGFFCMTQLLLHNRKRDLQHPRFSFEMSFLAYQQADALRSVKLDQKWEVSHVFPEWNIRQREQWDLRVPDGREWRSWFTVLTAPFVVQEKGALWSRGVAHTYCSISLVFSSHSVLGLHMLHMDLYLMQSAVVY